jgi:hypothetical protein
VAHKGDRIGEADVAGDNREGFDLAARAAEHLGVGGEANPAIAVNVGGFKEAGGLLADNNLPVADAEFAIGKRLIGEDVSGGGGSVHFACIGWVDLLSR